MRDDNIFSLETLAKITQDLRKNGRIIGLTHKAFDLFHASHLDLLQKASARCDYHSSTTTAIIDRIIQRHQD